MKTEIESLTHNDTSSVREQAVLALLLDEPVAYVSENFAICKGYQIDLPG